MPIIHDLTDGAGHGILIATDNIYLNALVAYVDADTSAAYAGAPSFIFAASNCELIYRFKAVTLQEYIGIVQSQSQSPG